MRLAPVLLVLALLFTVPVTSTGGIAKEPGLPEACEPSGPIDLRARTVSIAQQGANARVVVELDVLPHVTLPAARIRGTLADGVGFDGAFGIPDVITTLPRRAARSLQYELELERGEEHHLFFTVRSEDPIAAVPDATAYLRVNLNPALEPERRGGVLQFRARMTGR
jgi:hypothetical protein